jgi:molybdenum cofactor sulfurtransferase
MLRENKIHVRTGSHCNPGGAAVALGITPSQLESAGFRCNTKQDIIDGKPIGIVRITFGAMSTMSDVDALVDVVEKRIMDRGGAGH